MTVQQQNSQHRGSAGRMLMLPGSERIPPSRQNRTLMLIMLITYHAAGGVGRVAAGRHLSRGRRLKVRGHIGLHHAAAQRVGDEHSSGSPAVAASRVLSHHQRLAETPPRETNVFFIDCVLRTAVLSIIDGTHVTCQRQHTRPQSARRELRALAINKDASTGCIYISPCWWRRLGSAEARESCC